MEINEMAHALQKHCDNVIQADANVDALIKQLDAAKSELKNARAALDQYHFGLRGETAEIYLEVLTIAKTTQDRIHELLRN